MGYRELYDDAGELTLAMCAARDPDYVESNLSAVDGNCRAVVNMIGGKNARILFLSDDANYFTKSSLYEEYFNAIDMFLQPTMCSSDQTFTGNFNPSKDVVSLHLSHIDKFHKMTPQFTFDLIVGRALICWCAGASIGACGLQTRDTALGAKFLRRVWKLLSSTNKKATAYLHGMPGGSNEVMIDFWKAAGEIAIQGAGPSATFQKGMSSKKGETSFPKDMDISLLFKKKDLVCIKVNRTGCGLTMN